MKIHIHNLGCDKNRVDGEKLAARLRNAGCAICETPEEAELIVVNTCGFIGPAKEESLDAVFSAAKMAKVAVAGCLAERYKTQLKQRLKEADMVLGLADDEATFRGILKYCDLPRKSGRGPLRLISGPAYTAPLKIAEGCSNLCSYCAIPLIRGRQVSRPEKEILAEARFLRAQGVKELVLVAQDTTAYQDRRGLPGLLRSLSRLADPFDWIRLMYCHPSGVTGELIETIAAEKPVIKYIDLPLQHITDRLLKRMNRPYTRKAVEKILRELREKIPGVAIRTTFIIGFPGETDEAFEELREFIAAAKFDRMGAFTYSPEEGTKAFTLPGRVPEKIARDRLEALLYLQNDIIHRKNCSFIGKTERVLFEETGEGFSIGRTERDAPEVDCNVIVKGAELAPGTFHRIKISDAVGLDLYGSAP
jgi:ribosomal protein S12 methylthiotransferase